MDYNCQIMSFETHEEKYIEQQVDNIFEDVSRMSVRKRMVIAAFDLLPFIHEERLAQDEIQEGWFEQKKTAPKPTEETQRSSLGRSILEGFAGLGMGTGGAAYVPTPADDYRAGIVSGRTNKQDASLDEPTRLQRARLSIGAAKGFISEVYNLKPQQVEKVEKEVRRVKP